MSDGGRAFAAAARLAARFQSLAVFSSLLAAVAGAQESDDEFSLLREPLTGDWWGARSTLEDFGFAFEFYYTADVLSNVAGGRRRKTAYVAQADLLCLAELEPLAGWQGSRLFLYGLGVHGDSLSKALGDQQIVSSLDVLGVDTWKLYEAWFEQDLFADRVSLLVGLYDVNSEFDVIPSAGLFVNSSFGIGADIGLSGKNGPSIYPTTSLGARLTLRPAETVYVRAVVLDGVAGDPGDPFGTHVILKGEDGLLLASEIGVIRAPVDPDADDRDGLEPEGPATAHLRRGSFGKYAAGVWGYTSRFDDFSRVDASGAPLQRRGSHGAYLFAEQRLYSEAEDPRQGLALFARGGLADERVNPADAYLGGGAVYRGLIPGRDLDRTGLGVAAVHFGSEFRRAARLGGIEPREWEIALELTYRARLTAWLGLQPDLQYVVNPGGDADLDDAVVVAIRLAVTF